ncbi:uncharacterized protein LOC116027060 [Ipomoea triloba]|uniref:uncharacterized protein LOC116027060 n=1 Tax=Ipomoea triloba TaxID=35885 RepID=UPI00125E3495|nr:uncharacterized protein LOC116027060 [Ipomoea triloba]
MNCITWNCQGAGGRVFHRVLKNLLQTHKPAILGLVEPKVSGIHANTICKRLGFSDWVRVESVGFSGGIWVLWNASLRVSVIKTHPQFVVLQVRDDNLNPWYYAIVYGSPTHHLRRRLWSELNMAKLQLDGPCLVAGDFNSVLIKDETCNYTAFSTQRSSDFANWINSEGWIDMGFNGPPLTWVRGQVTGIDKGARLDRALCNVAWRQLFPESMVSHLPRLASDHAPLLITIEKRVSSLTRHYFKFQAAWFTDPSFMNLVRNSWVRTGDVCSNVNRVESALTIWNRSVFGNIHRRKKTVLARLSGVQRRLSTAFHRGLAKLEQNLTNEYHEILFQEELLWFQRSREEWINSDDRNTAYYHASTTIRKARNSIKSLRDDLGN